MALKVLDCARVLPGGDCTLILVGEPNEVLTAYDLHRRERQHPVSEIAPGREAENQLQNVVFAMPTKVYVGDDFDVDENTITIPGPGVVIQRFGPDTATASCKCDAGHQGTCTLTVSGGIATCTTGTCDRCLFETVATGFIEDETMPEFLKA